MTAEQEINTLAQKLLTSTLVILGIATTRAEGERLIQGGGVITQIKKLKSSVDELERINNLRGDALEEIIDAVGGCQSNCSANVCEIASKALEETKEVGA